MLEPLPVGVVGVVVGWGILTHSRQTCLTTSITPQLQAPRGPQVVMVMGVVVALRVPPHLVGLETPGQRVTPELPEPLETLVLAQLQGAPVIPEVQVL
jgi:hypothetical protein